MSASHDRPDPPAAPADLPDGLDAYGADYTRFAVADDQLVAGIVQRRRQMRALSACRPQETAAAPEMPATGASPRLPTPVDPPARGHWVEHRFDICAHVRLSGTACGRCIEICPRQALGMIGGAFRVDHAACSGCGVCSSVCPTGAMRSLSTLPEELLTVVQGRLADARLAHPGLAPTVVFHQGSPGGSTDRGVADSGQDLQGHLELPIAVAHIGSLGPEVWLGALAYGAGQVVVHLPDRYPEPLHNALAGQRDWVAATLSGLGLSADRVRLRPAGTVAAKVAAPVDRPGPPADFAPFQPKRALIRCAIAHLVGGGEPVNTVVRLPAGAPFGRISIAASACTLCMACVAACPTGALEAADDRHEVRMTATACIQCGRCRTICPEQAIALWPEIALDPTAQQHRHLLCAQAPFACLSCGRDFAPAGLIAKVIQRLNGHWATGGEREIRRLKMCPDCRVRDLLGDHEPKGCP